MTEIARVGDGQEHALPAVVARQPDDRNPYLTYIGRLRSEESRRTMARCLAEVARMLGFDHPADVPWEALRFQHVDRLRTLMSARAVERNGEAVPWSASTVNKHLSAIRSVTKQAWRLGLMAAEDYQRIKEIEGVKGSRLPAGRSIADGELAAMLRACMGSTIADARNAALIALLYSTGARRAEVAGARREHYQPGELALRIVGKGDKEREVYLTEDAAAYVGAWLAKTSSIRTGPLFLPIDKWGNVQRRHMTPRAVADVVNTVRERAGLPPLTAHDFRRTFIGNLLDEGVDLATAQALVGHASPATTAKYDRRPAARRKAAVARLRIPRPEDLTGGAQ